VAVEYVAAGKGEYQGELERQARREGLLGTAVKFPGTLGEHEVLELLRGSDVFVLASEGTFEAFPISVMEAMSCGRAVVASRIGSTPDMIEDGVSGLLIDQGDVDALTDRLGRLAADAGLRRRLGEAARRKAEAEFDVRVTARRLVEFVGGRLAETARSGRGTGVSPVHGPKGRPSERLLQGP
jgi:glycosyltransferase involved in cell wall biosynthesis